MRDCWEIGIKYPAGIKVWIGRVEQKKINKWTLTDHPLILEVLLALLPQHEAVWVWGEQPWLVLIPPRCQNLPPSLLCPVGVPNSALMSDWLQPRRGCWQTLGPGGGREARADWWADRHDGPLGGPAGSHRVLARCPRIWTKTGAEKWTVRGDTVT